MIQRVSDNVIDSITHRKNVEDVKLGQVTSSPHR